MVSDDGEVLTETDAWMVSSSGGGGGDAGNREDYSDYVIRAISDAVKDVEKEISSTWVRLVFGTAVNAWGARPLRGTAAADAEALLVALNANRSKLNQFSESSEDIQMLQIFVKFY